MNFIFSSFNDTQHFIIVNSFIQMVNNSRVQRVSEKPKLPEDVTKNMQSNGGHLNSNLFPSTPGFIPALKD